MYSSPLSGGMVLGSCTRSAGTKGTAPEQLCPDICQQWWQLTGNAINWCNSGIPCVRVVHLALLVVRVYSS